MYTIGLEADAIQRTIWSYAHNMAAFSPESFTVLQVCFWVIGRLILLSDVSRKKRLLRLLWSTFFLSCVCPILMLIFSSNSNKYISTGICSFHRYWLIVVAMPVLLLLFNKMSSETLRRYLFWMVVITIDSWSIFPLTKVPWCFFWTWTNAYGS